MEQEVPCCSVLQEDFVKEFEWIISFLNSRVTSLDVLVETSNTGYLRLDEICVWTRTSLT